EREREREIHSLHFSPSSAGMLKRTKYSRLRNDSLTSLEDRPERLVPSKRDLCLDSDFAQLDPGTPSPHGSSTLRNFIPRVASIRLQSPNCLRRVLKGQANTIRTVSKRDDRADWSSSLGGPDLIHPALLSTRRPITLHRMASLPCLRPIGPVLFELMTNGRRYMGSVEVVQSMRTLDFDTRMQVTREAISRLCERGSVKSLLKSRRPPCKGVSAVLGQINMQFSGSRAILTVSTDSLSLITASNLQRIVNHPMQGISFASGGDPDMSDYIAYVAKDFINKRECHIMECPQGRAGEVIGTIGQAFETRFRQTSTLLSDTATSEHHGCGFSFRSMVRICPRRSPKETSVEQNTKQKEEVAKQPDYYNVITGKTFFSLVGGKEGKHASKEEKKQEPDIQESLVYQEDWFHGRLDREQAESLLTCSGDFLVRESGSVSGQYVLSGMEGDTVRHILLVDSQGQVRTRNQVFQSVAHLVRFHMERQTPIFSGSSKLWLKQPILQSQ
uniref:SHC adaptor protein 4 n=1 Tax=Poecilia latipinna TaxID=48699 RepID=A0A3B3UM47_9TELE